MGGRVQSTWYAFNGTSNDDGTPGALSLDPAAGITRMRFTVDGKLEDQGGVGFAVQDGVVFSRSSCLTVAPADGEDGSGSDSPIAGRFDIAVRPVSSWIHLLLGNCGPRHDGLLTCVCPPHHRSGTASTQRAFSSSKRCRIV